MNEISKANRYRSYFEVAQKIKNPEARLAFYEAVDWYTFEGVEPKELPIEADIAFTAIKANIDADLKRKTGGAPLGNQNAKKQPTETIKNNLKQPVDLKETNNEDVEVEVNEDVDAHTEELKNACVPAYIPNPNKKLDKKLRQDLFYEVTKHNGTTTKDRMVPISKTQYDFDSKEMQELLYAIGPQQEGNNVRETLQNFLKVCRSDTWMKSHTWSNFCKHYTDYTPEFFTLERYLNAEPQTDDASKKPENAFFFAHKDDPEFHVETFQAHIDDWKAEGRPDGAAYLELQNKWEAENAD